MCVKLYTSSLSSSKRVIVHVCVRVYKARYRGKHRTRAELMSARSRSASAKSARIVASTNRASYTYTYSCSCSDSDASYSGSSTTSEDYRYRVTSRFGIITEPKREGEEDTDVVPGAKKKKPTVNLPTQRSTPSRQPSDALFDAKNIRLLRSQQEGGNYLETQPPWTDAVFQRLMSLGASYLDVATKNVNSEGLVVRRIELSAAMHLTDAAVDTLGRNHALTLTGLRVGPCPFVSLTHMCSFIFTPSCHHLTELFLLGYFVGSPGEDWDGQVARLVHNLPTATFAPNLKKLGLAVRKFATTERENGLTIKSAGNALAKLRALLEFHLSCVAPQKFDDAVIDELFQRAMPRLVSVHLLGIDFATRFNNLARIGPLLPNLINVTFLPELEADEDHIPVDAESVKAFLNAFHNLVRVDISTVRVTSSDPNFNILHMVAFYPLLDVFACFSVAHFPDTMEQRALRDRFLFVMRPLAGELDK